MKPSEKPDQPQMQPADPQARTRAVWAILAIVILSGAFATGLHFQGEKLEQMAQQKLIELADRPAILFLVAFVAMIPLVGASIPVFRQAGRIIKSGRIPPPGQKVIKDTPIITGRKAIRQGRGLQVMAILMALFGLLVPFGIAIVLMMLQKGT
jgi:hypothetical protein